MLATLLANIIPLWLLIGVGYIGGRWLDINLRSIARINIFILLPFVTFGAIVNMTLDPAYFLLPLLLAGIALGVTLASYKLARIVWGADNPRANLIGIGSPNGNTIYFGLPLVITYFGPVMAGLYLFMNLGPQIINLTLGYFISARGRHPFSESLRRVAMFPALHASWLGIAVNLTGWAPPEIFLQYWEYSAGATVILGMMMIGIALGRVKTIIPDLGLISGLFAVKFLAWPLAGLGVVMADQTLFHLFTAEIHQVLMLFTAMPLMGSLVAFAAEYDLYPEKAAGAVLLSVFAPLLVFPVLFWLLGVG